MLININLFNYSCNCFCCSCNCICIALIVCNVSFIVYVVCVLCLFDCGVLLSDVCYLCGMSYCSSLPPGKNSFAV
jgi:hypothetical protein